MTSLDDAKQWLLDNVSEGVTCPCCDQLAKVYQRSIHSGMARSLITMYRAAGTEWQHVPTTVGGTSREEGKLRYWGLVEESHGKREDGGRPGYWRVTRAGSHFVRLAHAVPKYASVYNGKCLGLWGPEIDIQDALGSKFDWATLMGTTELGGST